MGKLSAPAERKLVAAKGCQGATKRVPCDISVPCVRLVTKHCVSNGHDLGTYRVICLQEALHASSTVSTSSTELLLDSAWSWNASEEVHV